MNKLPIGIATLIFISSAHIVLNHLNLRNALFSDVDDGEIIYYQLRFGAEFGERLGASRKLGGAEEQKAVWRDRRQEARKRQRRRAEAPNGMRGWKFFKPNEPSETIPLQQDDIGMSQETSTPPLLQDVGITENDIMEPLRVCERLAPFFPSHETLSILAEYSQCHADGDVPDEEITILLLEGLRTFGRTGNNLIEFLHALQYAHENGVVVGIMKNSWATKVILSMWYSIQDDTWQRRMEEAFCVKIIDNVEDISRFKDVIHMETRDLFIYKANSPIKDYINFQAHTIRSLFLNYNQGEGLDMKNQQVGDMCSVLDAVFGPEEKSSAVYSVIHSRSLEGAPGLRLLGRIAQKSGCDPVAALEMEPEYVKSILGPIGMLDHPIIFITDNQRPEILERLLEDPEIGPQIRTVPEDASWIGGDMTVAIMSDTFIGNPASTFSGFIAKSRVALGLGKKNHMFRAKNENGEWEEVCGERCIFSKKVMNAMA